MKYGISTEWSKGGLGSVTICPRCEFTQPRDNICYHICTIFQQASFLPPILSRGHFSYSYLHFQDAFNLDKYFCTRKKTHCPFGGGGGNNFQLFSARNARESHALYVAAATLPINLAHSRTLLLVYSSCYIRGLPYTKQKGVTNLRTKSLDFVDKEG